MTNLSLKKLTFFCLLCVFILNAKAQLIPITLEQRIDNASAIIEGKVISQTSHWDETRTQIYTTNVIEVYKIFKGTLTSNQIEIITKGGIVGDDMQRVSHTLELVPGDVGVFTAVPNTFKIASVAKHPRFKAYAGLQGFIKYDLKNRMAKDPFAEYRNVKKDVYQKITTRTQRQFKILKAAPFNFD